MDREMVLTGLGEVFQSAIGITKASFESDGGGVD